MQYGILSNINISKNNNSSIMNIYFIKKTVILFWFHHLYTTFYASHFLSLLFRKNDVTFIT